jgi:hypothetical protein
MFRKIHTPDQIVNRIQENISSSFRPLENAPLYGSVLVENVSLTAGQDNLVSHKLTQKPIAWVIVGLNANTSVWSPVTASLENQSSNERLINLRCSANCVVSVLFS